MRFPSDVSVTGFNDMPFVVETVLMLTSVGLAEARRCMFEAHDTGVSLLLSTHQERAELYQQQFTSRGITVTIEPSD